MAGTWRVSGTPYDSGSSNVGVTATITVPAGVVTADFCLLVFSWVAASGETPPTITPSGGSWTTLVAPRTTGQMGVAVFHKTGLAAGNTFTVSLSSNRRVTLTHDYYKETSGFGTIGTITERGGVNGNTNTAADLTTVEPNQRVVIVSYERTTATGTTVSASGGTTQRDYYEASGSGGSAATCSHYVGDLTGPTPAGATGSVTLTYSHSSGNGGAFQIPLLTNNLIVTAARTATAGLGLDVAADTLAVAAVVTADVTTQQGIAASLPVTATILATVSPTAPPALVVPRETLFPSDTLFPTDDTVPPQVAVDATLAVTANRTAAAAADKPVAAALAVTAAMSATAEVSSGQTISAALAVTATITATLADPLPATLYFTPPHRGILVPFADPRIPETMTQPLMSLKPSIPQPPNLWLGEDGLLHERQPLVMTTESKVFYGGSMYGPLSAADIALIIASGYGAYLTQTPNPAPQP